MHIIRLIPLAWRHLAHIHAVRRRGTGFGCRRVLPLLARHAAAWTSQQATQVLQDGRGSAAEAARRRGQRRRWFRVTVRGQVCVCGAALLEQAAHVEEGDAA